jgi:hypothetical protein
MGKSINSYKIFTVKPHEKIPLRTLGLDVKKLHLISEKHIMKTYTVLKWFKKDPMVKYVTIIIYVFYKCKVFLHMLNDNHN